MTVTIDESEWKQLCKNVDLLIYKAELETKELEQIDKQFNILKESTSSYKLTQQSLLSDLRTLMVEEIHKQDKKIAVMAAKYGGLAFISGLAGSLPVFIYVLVKLAGK
jgi:hypothetical protein